MDNNLVVLKYQNNLADNLSAYAYAGILKKTQNVDYAYENSTKERIKFEKMMNNININYSYISKSRFDAISKNSRYIDYRDFNSNKKVKNSIINLPHFKIDDIDKIDTDILSDFKFKNTDFILNYDILDDIKNCNAIGLYISDNDEIDKDYINRALIRLNKYIKRPILYVFCKKDINIDSVIPFKHINLSCYDEELYFLISCKHIIIHCTKFSYSTGFWASVLSGYKYGYTTYDKKLHPSKHKQNWIAI